MEKCDKNLGLRVSAYTMIGNILLSVGKLLVGLTAHSGALVSDAVHSASDVLTTVLVMVGLKTAEKSPDKEHPYGHERFECVFSMVLAGMLFAAGALIGYQAIRRLLEGTAETPGALALAAAAVSVAVKEAMYHYTIRAARTLHSTALKADAWHHRSDALSSVGSFLGVLGARMGYPRLDAAACLLICLLIFKVAYDVFREALMEVVDTSCSPEVEAQMRAAIAAEKGVLGIDLLNTRRFGTKIYVDVEIRADGAQSLEQAHAIAERVHDRIEREFGGVKHCMVHVNPAKE